MNRSVLLALIVVAVSIGERALAAEPATRPATAPAVVPLRTFDFAGEPSRPADGVVVDVHPPSTERRRYDAATMPPDQVQASEGFVAATNWNLAQASWSWYTPLRDVESNGQHHVLIRLDAVHIALWCHTTMFLPDGASDLLVRHENGHRRIAEQAYVAAPEEARRFARSIIGQCFAGHGDTKAAAERNALNAVGDVLNAAYGVTVIDRVSAAQDAFDFVTQHNENPQMPGEAGVDQAIRVAFFIESLSEAERNYRKMSADGPSIVPVTIDVARPTTAPATATVRP